MPLFQTSNLMDEMRRSRYGTPDHERRTVCIAPTPRARPWSTLVARRSVRRYSAKPVPDTVLHGALAALEGRLRDTPDGLQLALADADGLWKAGPTGRVRRLADPPDLREQYVPAPLYLLFFAAVTDPAEYLRRCVEAGAAGYSCWLDMIDAGLAGCPFGRSEPGVGHALRAAGLVGARHLSTIAVGYAEDET